MKAPKGQKTVNFGDTLFEKLEHIRAQTGGFSNFAAHMRHIAVNAVAAYEARHGRIEVEGGAEEEADAA